MDKIKISLMFLLWSASIITSTSGTVTKFEQNKTSSNVMELLKHRKTETVKEENDIFSLQKIVTDLQETVDDILKRLDITDKLIEEEKGEGRRIRRDSSQDLPVSQISGCTPGTIGCSGPYTPYFMGQCFLCPPGPQGPQGSPGGEGERGRDGRDGRDGDRGPKGDTGNCDESDTDITDSISRHGLGGPPSNTSGVTYVRWGRSECPQTSELVYAGVAGGEFYSNKGGASNYLCLPHEPIYDEPEVSAHTVRGYVYGTEYQTNTYPPYAHLYENEVPCAVCKAVQRYSHMMVPARNTCPGPDWTLEYYGHLMTDRYNHERKEYVCVDRNAEAVPSSVADVNGALLYPVEGRCSTSGGLPCGPYVNGYELTCAVCTL